MATSNSGDIVIGYVYGGAFSGGLCVGSGGVGLGRF
jgi:hypothetical protein